MLKICDFFKHACILCLNCVLQFNYLTCKLLVNTMNGILQVNINRLEVECNKVAKQLILREIHQDGIMFLIVHVTFRTLFLVNIMIKVNR